MDHKYPYKVINNKIPSYIFNIIPFKKRKLDTRNLHNLPHLKVKYIFYKCAFIPSEIFESSKLDNVTINITILASIKSESNRIVNIHSPIDVNYLLRLRPL